MTGFKSGASPSAFGDDDDVDEEPEPRETDSDASVRESATERENAPSLPWIYARSSITDGREQTVQLHLQQSTLERQSESKAAVESELGETVKKADLREAALLVGLSHVDDVADVLREWGYDFE